VDVLVEESFHSVQQNSGVAVAEEFLFLGPTNELGQHGVLVYPLVQKEEEEHDVLSMQKTSDQLYQGLDDTDEAIVQELLILQLATTLLV
jgi:hypothetical protein